MIDNDLLLDKIMDTLDESIHDEYDFDKILGTASIIWGETAIQVTGTNFSFIYDIETYELLAAGFDACKGIKEDNKECE